MDIDYDALDALLASGAVAGPTPNGMVVSPSIDDHVEPEGVLAQNMNAGGVETHEMVVDRLNTILSALLSEIRAREANEIFGGYDIRFTSPPALVCASIIASRSRYLEAFSVTASYLADVTGTSDFIDDIRRLYHIQGLVMNVAEANCREIVDEIAGNMLKLSKDMERVLAPYNNLVDARTRALTGTQ